MRPKPVTRAARLVSMASELGTAEAPTQLTAVVRAAAPRRQVLVFSDAGNARYPLPETGSVLIGRGDAADVRIDHPSISRQHARLHLGPAISIEDLGSSNGTRVGDRRLGANQSIEVAAGDVIEIGTAMLTVQLGGGSARPRRLWTHGYFEGRLEEECARAEHAGHGFAVVRVHVEGEHAPPSIEAAIGEALGPTDLVAAYGPGEYEVLLLGEAGEQAEAAVQRLATSLRARGARTRAGVAVYPKDGRSPEALIAYACATVRGDEPAAAKPRLVQDGAMQRLHRLVEKIAAGSISVLLLGETGVGKEVLAETIHRRSPRAKKPFVRFNCAALAESLLESELFGHERGAFTGAVATKVGLLESADGGTVFLDEIGELGPSLQVKLLRVLEERQILRVGSVKPRPIDVRFIAATNRDLEAAVRLGGFREDLFFRLAGVTLVIPPLRERVSEIDGLCAAFVVEASTAAGRDEAPCIAKEALALLRRYVWPGNIRELRNVMERAVLLCGAGPIGLEHLPVDKLSATLLAGQEPASYATHATGPALDTAPPSHRLSPPTLRPDAKGSAADLRTEVAALERQRILEALQRCGGNQTRAAKALGMPRRTLVSRLAAYGIPRPRG